MEWLAARFPIVKYSLYSTKKLVKWSRVSCVERGRESLNLLTRDDSNSLTLFDVEILLTTIRCRGHYPHLKS